MTLEELRVEAEKFFEWPSDTKDHVTLTSAIIFAQLMMQKERENLKRPAPCEMFCEKTAFNAEIRRLKAKIEDADYLIGAFERGCDSDDYYMDIANYKGT